MLGLCALALLPVLTQGLFLYHEVRQVFQPPCHFSHVADELRSDRASRVAKPALEVVIATNTGRFDWGSSLRKDGHQVRTYCTGLIALDGRCEHFFENDTASALSTEAWVLRHIVMFYDQLADVTLFTHDALDAEASARRLLTSVDTAEKRRSFVGFAASEYLPVSLDDLHHHHETCDASATPYRLWYAFYVNVSDIHKQHVLCTATSADTVFAVSRERVLSLPRWRYREMLQEVSRCRASDSVAGQYMRRSWSPLFAQECHQEEALWTLQALQALEPPRQAVTHAADQSLDIVVASYHAPLGWLDPLLQRLPTAQLYLYCKGNHTRDPRCIALENDGTEEYAYLHHILRNWDNLADITVFSTDNILLNGGDYNPAATDCLEFVASSVDSREERAGFSGFEALQFEFVEKAFDIHEWYSSSLPRDGLEKEVLCNASKHPFGAWYLRFINPEDVNFRHLACTAASMRGIFAVSRERVHRVPKSTFEGLMGEVERCRGMNGFVAGHYMERSWSALFSESCHTHQAEAEWRRRIFREHFRTDAKLRGEDDTLA